MGLFKRKVSREQVNEYYDQLHLIIISLDCAAITAAQCIISAKCDVDRLNVIDFVSNVLREGYLTEKDFEYLSDIDCYNYSQAIKDLNSSMNNAFYGITNTIDDHISNRRD